MPRLNKLQDVSELTAQPTKISTQVGSVPPTESGLSLEPEDLGRQFLSSAVEQGGARGLHALENQEVVSEDEPPADDEAWLGSVLDTDQRGWERLVRRALASGRAAWLTPPRVPEEMEPLSRGWDEVDLTDEAIQEASLLDHEGSELGEVEEPSVVKTDDTHTHGKRRGGHLPTPPRLRGMRPAR